MAEPSVALSVQQPWAWLIVNGHKDIENRDWHTRFRGPVFIHAGKKFDAYAYDWACREFPLIEMPHREALETGGIVGRVEIADCVGESDSEWFMGAYGFVLRNARPLPFTPLRGQLGFFPVPAETVRSLSEYGRSVTKEKP